MEKSQEKVFSGWFSRSKQEANRQYLLPIAVVLASVLLLQVSNPPQAKSVSRGNIEIGSKFVVSLVKNGEQWSACSGSLMSSDVVVTAAHCVYGANYIAKPFGLSVTLPGSVINSSARPKLFQVEKIIVAPTFGRLVKNPNQYSVDVDDIAFLFLVEPIPSFEAVQIADSRLVTRMKNEELDIKHYGYGLQKQTPATLDGNPYSVILKATNNPVSGKSPSANDERVIYSKGTIPGPAICSGDSGGPGYVREGEKIYLVSVMSGAGGCDSSTNLAHTFSTLIYPHLSLLQSEYQLFSLQKSAEKSALELKAKQEADAKAAAELKANQEADAKAAAELKAKQEADAKAAADKIIADAKVEAERILAAARAATTKKTTINCVKGKLTKKVTAVKPKCPSGYKVKK